MTAVLTFAAKELRTGIRNRWILAATLILAGLALALAFLGSAPVGEVGADRLSVTVVSLTSLSVFLVPLIALMLAYDALVGEIERGTMLLTLAYPVERWQILAGKFLGHVAILAIATAVGYGLAAAAIAATSGIAAAGLAGLLRLVASSVLLGAAFVAVGYLVSALARQRATAAGAALAVWLLLVVVYDLALLGALTGAGELISETLFTALLLANPADLFRMINLAASEAARSVAGMAGAAGAHQPGTAAMAGLLLLWSAVPLLLSGLAFKRRDV